MSQGPEAFVAPLNGVSQNLDSSTYSLDSGDTLGQTLEVESLAGGEGVINFRGNDGGKFSLFNHSSSLPPVPNSTMAVSNTHLAVVLPLLAAFPVFPRGNDDYLVAKDWEQYFTSHFLF